MAGIDADLRFPFINLETALGRAKQIFDADQQCRPMAVLTAFEVWQYSSKSSGGHQTIGALKLYDMLDDTGKGADRRLFLSQRAKHYFLDEREDERKAALKAFALSPPLIASLWSEWGASPPADNIARSHLKLDRRMNDQSSRALLGIYKDNVAFADLKGDDKAPEVTPELNETPAMTNAATLEKPETKRTNTPPAGATGGGAAAENPRVGPQPKVSIDGDQLTIAATIPMSELPTLLKKIKALMAFYDAG
jgi:hypothetical protein